MPRKKKKKPQDRTEYQKDYYLRNKEKIAQRKKYRYENDPAVRQQLKESSEVYRAKKRAEYDKLLAEGKIVHNYPRGPRPAVKVAVNGVDRDGHTITILASRIDRSVETLNNWQKIGTLPMTPYRSPRGDRLYTDAMILAVKMAVQSFGLVGKSPVVCDKITNAWINLGVPMKG